MLTDSKPLTFVLGVDEELAVDGGEEVDAESRWRRRAAMV